MLRDCAPSVILTTAPAIDAVTPYAQSHERSAAPVVIDVDTLDLDSPRFDSDGTAVTKTAYLQYTSGSTRIPAGVVISHENVIENVHQALHDCFGPAVPAEDHVRLLAALLSRHGFDHGCLRAAGAAVGLRR